MGKRTNIMMGGKPLLSGEILKDEENGKYYVKEDETDIKVYVSYPISCLMGSDEVDVILQEQNVSIYATEQSVSYQVRFDEENEDVFLVADNGDQISIDEAPIRLLYARRAE